MAKHKLNRMYVRVSFDNIPGLQMAELREYIRDALETWGGQRRPDDILFNSLKDVRVTPIAD